MSENTKVVDHDPKRNQAKGKVEQNVIHKINKSVSQRF